MDNDIQHVLGRRVAYPDQYAPDILVRVPRIENRRKYGIDESHLPFTGADLWNCYETSALTDKGAPVNFIVRIRYACTSRYIVESKSLKLYLNALNMTPCGATREAVRQFLTETIARDLSALLETEVAVCAETPEEAARHTFSYPSVEKGETTWEYWGIEQLSPEPLSAYTQDVALLCSESARSGTLQGHTDLLRSRCKITSQPDWGDLYLYMKGDELPAVDSLLRYIVSFRNENHFHEEVVEMIFNALHTRFAPENLLVMAFYTRRGGIDINPVRATDEKLIETFCGHLTHFRTLAVKLPRQ